MSKTTQTLLIKVDQHELACRLAEAIVQCKRPEGATAAQALAEFDEAARQNFYRAAIVAIQYLNECFENMDMGKTELILPGKVN